MSKPKYDDIQAFIDAWSPVWVERMQLGDYLLEHAFLDSYFGDDGEEDFKITATTETRPQYLQAKIKWYLPSAVRHEADVLEHTLVHELCHVLLGPEQGILQELRNSDLPHGDKVADLYAYQLENVTERVCRVLVGAYGLVSARRPPLEAVS